MTNLWKHILRTQNENFQINCLLAQRNIYSNAKILQIILFVIAVIIPVALAFFIKYYPQILNEKNSIYCLYLVLALASEKVLEYFIKRKKKIAASIQELFDRKVLLIKENNTLDRISVDEEIIRNYSRKASKNAKKVREVVDWYSKEVFKLKTNVATVLCQRTNIYYDFSVRDNYKIFLYLVVITTFVILLIFSLWNDNSIKSFLIEVLIPTIPIFNFVYKEINQNNESIDNLKCLKEIIENILQNIKNTTEIDEKKIREIQDRIFLNRILNPLIPDYLYKILRPRLEDEMNYSIEQKINQLR